MQLPGRHAGLTITVSLVAVAVLTVTLLGRPSSVGLTGATPAAGTGASVAVPPAPPPAPSLHDHDHGHDHGVDGLTAVMIGVDGLVLLVLGVLFLRSRSSPGYRALPDRPSGVAFPRPARPAPPRPSDRAGPSGGRPDKARPG